MKNLIYWLVIAMLMVMAAGAHTPAAQGCPGCKESLLAEQEDSLGSLDGEDALGWNPAYSYSYSVLFMLAVPAALLLGFGTAFYRLSRKANLENQRPPA
jgi:hypothetical protein